jgi:hypothetical protein
VSNPVQAAQAKLIHHRGAAASKFSSAAHQLVSLYIPSTVLPALASVASAHSVSGTNILSILESVFTATTTPEWFTAIPTQYSTNIAALESKIEELRGAAIAGSISGAPKVITSTDGEGKTVVTTSLPTGVSAGSTGSTTGGTSSSPSETLLTGTRTTTGEGPTTTPAIGGISSSSSSGHAQATQIPGVAVGVMGLFGAMLAL